MRKLRGLVRAVARRLGYDVRRVWSGQEPFKDALDFLKGQPNPVVIDVGANIGQTANVVSKLMPQAIIHSFEPSPSTFAQLQRNCRTCTNVTTWNRGVGSCVGELPFIENTNSDMSSFLQPGVDCWGAVNKRTTVPVITLDAFVEEQAIPRVSLLKSDTQGFDFEVFKGASGLLADDRVGLIYFEFIFSSMYENLPKFHDVFQFLTERRFSLVGIYQQHRQRHCLSWADLLFVHQSLREVANDSSEVRPTR